MRDYEHLIIDLRGNNGGFAGYVLEVIGTLIAEPLLFQYYEFFSGGEMAVQMMKDSLGANMILGAAADALRNAREVIQAENMTAFNEDDLAYIEHAVQWHVMVEPAENGTPFEGEIWILVDGGSASASELFALIAMETGFATVVGTPTWGVTPVHTLHVPLPQTGVVFRFDIGSLLDTAGRSMEEFGITPQIASAEGLDALATVMTLIRRESTRFASVPRRHVGGTVFVPIRLAAYANGASVAWDGVNRTVTVTKSDGSDWVVSTDGAWNDDGTVYVPIEYAYGIFT